MAEYGQIQVYQNDKPVMELVSIPGPADHTGWRGYLIPNIKIVMPVSRSEASLRYFADIKCATDFPEFDAHYWHNAGVDMAEGIYNADAVVGKYGTCSIPMNFKNPHNTVMDIKFHMGAGPLAKCMMPVKFPSSN